MVSASSASNSKKPLSFYTQSLSRVPLALVAMSGCSYPVANYYLGWEMTALKLTVFAAIIGAFYGSVMASKNICYKSYSAIKVDGRKEYSEFIRAGLCASLGIALLSWFAFYNPL